MVKAFVKISFRHSRSKFYSRVVKLASEFDDFKQDGVNVVSITEVELLEKWEFFNLLFWKTVDWKGSVLEYDGMKYYGHSDKTRIFYALQHSHAIHICSQVRRIKELREIFVSDVISQQEYVIMFN
jgi:hypothetical protein